MEDRTETHEDTLGEGDYHVARTAFLIAQIFPLRLALGRSRARMISEKDQGAVPQPDFRFGQYYELKGVRLTSVYITYITLAWMKTRSGTRLQEQQHQHAITRSATTRGTVSPQLTDCWRTVHSQSSSRFVSSGLLGITGSATRYYEDTVPSLLQLDLRI